MGGTDAGITHVAAINSARPAGLMWLFAYNPDAATDGVVATTVAVRTQGITMPIFRGRVLSPYEREWLENRSPRVRGVTMVGQSSALPAVADMMIEKARR